MKFVQASKLRAEIPTVFLPGTPISTYDDLFSGRTKQMTAIHSAILQPGRHVILFGERGVGKTSLAQVLVDIKRNDGFRTLETGTMNCNEGDDFSSLWHNVFCALPYDEVDGMTRYIDVFLDEIVTPDNVRFALSRYKEPSLIVIDEMDQLKNEEAKSLLTATLKNLSDHRVNTTLILVGVADTVNELIVERKSAERSLVQVRMPRMSPDELATILDRGLSALGMTIEPYAKELIVGLSKRLPFYTHSFGLYAGLKAIDKGRTIITRDDVVLATLDVTDSAFNVQTAYYEATRSNQKSSRYDAALQACAFCETNDLGFFPAIEMGKWFSALQGKAYKASGYMHYLNEFVEERGHVLERAGEKRKYVYRFTDPLMQPFVLIHAFGRGELDPGLLAHILSQSRVTYPAEDELPF